MEHQPLPQDEMAPVDNLPGQEALFPDPREEAAAQEAAAQAAEAEARAAQGYLTDEERSHYQAVASASSGSELPDTVDREARHNAQGFRVGAKVADANLASLKEEAASRLGRDSELRDRDDYKPMAAEKARVGLLARNEHLRNSDIDARVEAEMAKHEGLKPGARHMLETNLRTRFQQEADEAATAAGYAAANAREAHINANGGIDNLENINRQDEVRAFQERIGVGHRSGNTAEAGSVRMPETEDLVRPDGVGARDWLLMSAREKRAAMASATETGADNDSDPTPPAPTTGEGSGSDDELDVPEFMKPGYTPTPAAPAGSGTRPRLPGELPSPHPRAVGSAPVFPRRAPENGAADADDWLNGTGEIPPVRIPTGEPRRRLDNDPRGPVAGEAAPAAGDQGEQQAEPESRRRRWLGRIGIGRRNREEQPEGPQQPDVNVPNVPEIGDDDFTGSRGRGAMPDGSANPGQNGTPELADPDISAPVPPLHGNAVTRWYAGLSRGNSWDERPSILRTARHGIYEGWMGTGRGLKRAGKWVVSPLVERPEGVNDDDDLPAEPAAPTRPTSDGDTFVQPLPEPGDVRVYPSPARPARRQAPARVARPDATDLEGLGLMDDDES